MAVFVANNNGARSLHDACKLLTETLCALNQKPRENFIWQQEIDIDELDTFLVRVRGAERVFFKSRDSDFTLVGFGAADKILSSCLPLNSPDFALEVLVEKAKTLFVNQVYFGAMRFDESSDISFEWREFGKKLFILPLVTMVKRGGISTLSVNFRSDGNLDWPVFQDRAATLLRALMYDPPAVNKKRLHVEQNYLPSKEQFSKNIHRALNDFVLNPAHKKVVIGRRNCLSLGDDTDPAYLFSALKEKTNNAFFFFIDPGFGNAFFGVSPELLYRRQGEILETESLAGTRARACDEAIDDSLRTDLLKSIKDNQEHALVSLHIEERLKDFGTTDLCASKLEIMALTFVQHLLRRYRGVISESVNDAAILPSLHPTPAVCGLEIEWARDFIRHYEGFDRGFYAGPVGYVGKDNAEFAVAIRSALFDQQQLYVYAACGIVPGSNHNLEWEELNNKEKSVLCIFDRDK